MESPGSQAPLHANLMPVVRVSKSSARIVGPSSILSCQARLLRCSYAGLTPGGAGVVVLDGSLLHASLLEEYAHLLVRSSVPLQHESKLGRSRKRDFLFLPVPWHCEALTHAEDPKRTSRGHRAREV